MDTKQRETKEIKVGEHTVVIKTYCTGREANEIEQVYLAGTKVSMVGTTPTVDGFSPTVEQDANKKAIEVLVVSLDGTNDDLVNRILDLPNTEYVQIVAALGEISGKKKASA